MKNTLYDKPLEYDLQYLDYTKDLPFWEWLAFNYANGKPIGEFACGTGRVTIYLAQLGYQMIGVDISLPMLDLCKKKAKNARLSNIVLFHGNMCDFVTGTKHALVTVPFTSFLHLTDRDDQMHALSNFHAQLTDGGHLLIDIINPDRNKLNQLKTFQKQVQNDAIGETLKRWNWSIYDENTKTATWGFECIVYDSKTMQIKRSFNEEAMVSIIFPDEWRELLQKAGFEIVIEYGNFRRDLFCESYSPRMLFLCRKI